MRNMIYLFTDLSACKLLSNNEGANATMSNYMVSPKIGFVITELYVHRIMSTNLSQKLGF